VKTGIPSGHLKGIKIVKINIIQTCSHQRSAILRVDTYFKCKVKYRTLIYPKALLKEMGEKI